MAAMQGMPSPYRQGLRFIQDHSGTGAAVGMIKLLASLAASDICFSFRECVREFDTARQALAVRIIQHFFEVGANDDLAEILHILSDTESMQIEIGRVGFYAMVEKKREIQEAR